MQLPANFATVLDDGVAVLGDVEADLERMVRIREEPDTLLFLRDVSVLLARLTMESEDGRSWWWSSGIARLNLSPLDLGVLDALVDGAPKDSPYRDSLPVVDSSQSTALRLLRDFLWRYLEGQFGSPDLHSDTL